VFFLGGFGKDLWWGNSTVEILVEGSLGVGVVLLLNLWSARARDFQFSWLDFFFFTLKFERLRYNCDSHHYCKFLDYNVKKQERMELFSSGVGGFSLKYQNISIFPKIPIFPKIS